MEKHVTKGLEGRPEGWFGIYVKSLTNRSNESISIEIRESGTPEWINLNPGESRGSDFPFPWVSSIQYDYKCIILKIGGKAIALWDDHPGQAYCNPTGMHWTQNGDPIKGSDGHGDYTLIFNSDASFELRKRS